MVIITAADTTYFGGLINLVGSVHYWMPGTRILIYDLGLKKRCKREIRRWQNVDFIEDFLSGLPDHCSELKIYAWKPQAILAALQEHEAVLWIDAGSDVRAPLDSIRSHLLKDGHFFVKGQDVDMTQMSHPGSYRCLGADLTRFIGYGHYAGNLQGYCIDSLAYNDVLVPMQRAALDKYCIAPQGSSLSNHRFDQTLLSIILYQSGLDVTEHTEMLAADRSQLHPDPCKSSNRSVFTARTSSREYCGMVRDHSDSKCYPGMNEAEV